MEPSEAAQRIFDAYRTGDLSGMQSLISPAITLHMPGENVLAGEYSGMGAVLALVARAAVYLAPSSVQVLGVDTNEGEVVARVSVGGGLMAAHGGELRLNQRMRFDETGQIREAWIEPDDLQAWDALVGRAAGASTG